MAIRLLGIGGEPASGKSSILRQLFPDIAATTVQPIRLVRYHQLDSDGQEVYVIGDYSSGDMFGGTDKLSMAVLPEFLDVLRVWSTETSMDGAIVLFEGDRLFSRKTFEAVDEMNEEMKPTERVLEKYLVLDVDDIELIQRHNDRGDTQSGSWLKGRATKIETLCRDYPKIEVRANNTKEESTATVELLRLFISEGR